MPSPQTNHDLLWAFFSGPGRLVVLTLFPDGQGVILSRDRQSQSRELLKCASPCCTWRPWCSQTTPKHLEAHSPNVWHEVKCAPSLYLGKYIFTATKLGKKVQSMVLIWLKVGKKILNDNFMIIVVPLWVFCYDMFKWAMKTQFMCGCIFTHKVNVPCFYFDQITNHIVIINIFTYLVFYQQ